MKLPILTPYHKSFSHMISVSNNILKLKNHIIILNYKIKHIIIEIFKKYKTFFLLPVNE